MKEVTEIIMEGYVTHVLLNENVQIIAFVIALGSGTGRLLRGKTKLYKVILFTITCYITNNIVLIVIYLIKPYWLYR